MTETLMFSLLDFSQLFILETNASAVAIGAILSQQGHPLAFFSKKLCNRLQASYVYVREMYVIIEAVKNGVNILLVENFIFTLINTI